MAAFVRKFFVRKFAAPVAGSGSSLPSNVVLDFSSQAVVSFNNQYIVTF